MMLYRFIHVVHGEEMTYLKVVCNDFFFFLNAHDRYTTWVAGDFNVGHILLLQMHAERIM